MIPKKADPDVDLNEQIDKDLAKAQEQQSEKLDKNKPKLAQALGSKYVKYITVIGIGCAIGYKMFFTPTKVEPKKKKVKKELISKEAKEQKKLADSAVAKQKKGEIVTEKTDTSTIISIDEQTLTNANAISNIAVPKLNVPEIPAVPTIDKIIIEEDEEIRKKKQAEKEEQNKQINDLKDTIKKNEESIEALKETIKNNGNKQHDKNSDDSNKKLPELTNTKKVKKKIRDANGRSRIVEVDVEVDNNGNIVKELSQSNSNEVTLGSPLSKQIQMQNASISSDTDNASDNSGSSARSGIAKKSLDEMFILSGKGASSQNSRSSSKDSKRDVIIFDGSGISEKEISTVDKANENVDRISNLENTIVSGKVIEAVLETAIYSQAAGTVRAVISRDVLGEMGSKILIPRGSRVYGSYATTATTTQTRLLITWTKVIRPDGIVITMNADTYDQSGKKGIEGDIDTRYGELFRNSLLYSFVTLGTAIAVEKIAGIKGSTSIVAGNGTSVTNTSPANAAANSVIETARDIADKMTDGLTDDLKPIVSIPQGVLLKLISSTDIVINSAYNRRTKNLMLN